jgi:hypothetical protein
VLRETTSRCLCGLVCPSRGEKGDFVKEGGGDEWERKRERALDATALNIITSIIIFKCF